MKRDGNLRIFISLRRIGGGFWIFISLRQKKMLDMEVRRMFKRGKLYEKEGLFYTTICYENPLIKIERIYPKEEKKQIYSLVLDLYFEYEWHWQELSLRQLGKLAWVDHKTIASICNKFKWITRSELKEYNV